MASNPSGPPTSNYRSLSLSPSDFDPLSSSTKPSLSKQSFQGTNLPRRKGSQSPNSPPRKQIRTYTHSCSLLVISGQPAVLSLSLEDVVGSLKRKKPSNRQQPVSEASTANPHTSAQSDPISMAEALCSSPRTSECTPAVKPYHSRLSLPTHPSYTLHASPSLSLFHFPLNDGLLTHYYCQTSSFNHIDVSLCSALPLFSWHLLSSFRDSDHYPILLIEVSRDSSPCPSVSKVVL